MINFFLLFFAILYSKISICWEIQISFSKLWGLKIWHYPFSTIQVSSCIGWKNWGLGPTHMGPTYGVKMGLTVLFWTSVRRFIELAVQGVSFEIFWFETAPAKRWFDLDTKFLDQNWFERWQFFVLDFEKNFWLCTKIWLRKKNWTGFPRAFHLA